jgi:hypothetical protein
MNYYIKLARKAILRSLTAAVGPMVFYTLFLYLCIAMGLISKEREHHARLSLIVLVWVSINFYKIGLFVTLRPIEILLDWFLWIDNSKNFSLRGNYAPIDKELNYNIDKSMIKEGAIPSDLNGVFLRNGPNPLFMPPHGRHHWFDGDGHIHGFRIKNGKASYCNR